MIPSVVATRSATSLALSGGISSTCTRPVAISSCVSCQFLFQAVRGTAPVRVMDLAMMYSTCSRRAPGSSSYNTDTPITGSGDRTCSSDGMAPLPSGHHMRGRDVNGVTVRWRIVLATCPTAGLPPRSSSRKTVKPKFSKHCCLLSSVELMD